MKLQFLDEPELEFGGLRRHVDIRRGLWSFGPLDSVEGQTRRLRIGIVGTQQTVDGLRRWLDRCQAGIKAKASRQPNLFPDFPGFGPTSPFQAEMDIDESHVSMLSPRDVQRVAGQSFYRALTDGVDLLADAVQAVSDKGRPDVVVVALPDELAGLEDDDDGEQVDELRALSRDVKGPPLEQEALDYVHDLDLRNMLKSRVMRFGQPIQIVLPSTFGEGQKPRKSKRSGQRALQDEATRAWNFHVALYYKAGLRPWRIVRRAADLHSCYVGISFYRSLDRENLMTSMAQVYDERGEGVIVRGNPVKLSKDDRQPHLSDADSFALLTHALKQYRHEHKHAPARIVVHKSSSYSDEELEGFGRAIDDLELETADLLVVSKAMTRLFRPGNYPPLRGQLLSLDATTHLVYARGSVPYYATYPGMYVPRPLKFQIAKGSESPLRLAEELLALTKLNWNNTQFDGSEPITMRVARQVGKILKYVGVDGVVQPRYSFYM